jgi:hypothetical protein
MKEIEARFLDIDIEEIRKNLYKGVLEGCAFCSIESE